MCASELEPGHGGAEGTSFPGSLRWGPNERRTWLLLTVLGIGL